MHSLTLDTRTTTSVSHQVRRCGVIARLALTVALAGAFAACDARSPLAPSSPALLPGGSSDLAFCVDEVNRYRKSIGQPSLVRSEPLEAFAAQAAERDGTAHVAHHHFSMTNGAGVAMAETEILWWRGHAVRAVIEKGLAQMWKVGPSGEHYDILAGAYREVGCGVFVNGSEVTVTQDFR